MLNMGFIFENIITPDSETYRVQLNGKDIGYVFKDKEQEVWAAMCPDSQLRESEVWANRESAAQYLAKKAGII